MRLLVFHFHFSKLHQHYPYPNFTLYVAFISDTLSVNHCDVCIRSHFFLSGDKYDETDTVSEYECVVFNVPHIFHFRDDDTTRDRYDYEVQLICYNVLVTSLSQARKVLTVILVIFLNL